MCLIGIGTKVAALNSEVVPISHVVLKTGFTVYVPLCVPIERGVYSREGYGILIRPPAK